MKQYSVMLLTVVAGLVLVAAAQAADQIRDQKRLRDGSCQTTAATQTRTQQRARSGAGK